MKKKQSILFIVLDLIVMNLSFILALYIRFEGQIGLNYFKMYKENIIGILVIKLVILYLFKLYKGLWEYASIDELIEVVLATLIGGIISVAYIIILGANIPRSVYVMVTLFDMVFIGGTRFFYRIYRRLKNRALRTSNDPRILIIGAGAAGVMVLNEIRSYEGKKFVPIAFVDDDPLKRGKVINRIPVVGNRYDIVSICEKYNIDEIILAMPSAKKIDIKNIIAECSKTKCKTRTLPGVYDLIDGKATISQIRDVEINDLLGREEIQLNSDDLDSFIKGNTVLVTGGGGSIGSELCRQIVKFNPKQLIIFDIYENSAYDIQNELLRKYNSLNLRVLIGSVRDKARLEEVMKRYKPNIIFHAAAHKHVPLMEKSPKDAIKNNIFGTLNLVQAASKHHVSKFIQISTDKAVNPTNVMGATKRMCEMIIQAHNSISDTEYVAVRFGNVLGSNGSVIPLFKKQIAEGGPVTVTDERVIRYFMTIPEACQLVLQAGAMANGGEIFILDMGEPVKIIDLAIHLIRLSGFEPGIDIKINITGLRPGEKLYEELLLNKEVATQTSHKKIFVEPPENIDYDELITRLHILEDSMNFISDAKVKNILVGMDLGYEMEKAIN